MIRIGIIGAAGYTAGELIRLLMNHPQAQIVFAHSESQDRKPVWTVHEGLYAETDLSFTSTFDLNDIDVLFLCSGHGRSTEFWQQNALPDHLKVIDLAQDYRDESCGYVYGLPELQRERISSARLVANPGCFATAMQLALLPLAQAGMLNDDIEVNGITGSTGAGQKPQTTTHFSWRTDNISVYKLFNHQHLLEVGRNIRRLQNSWNGQIHFVPMRGDFARGIYLTAYTHSDMNEQEAQKLYKDYYEDSPFTFVYPEEVDIKQVVNTNKCLLSVRKVGDKLIVSSVIDNLIKGASGQAVENMNLMFGLPETCGLKLKASAF